MIGIRLRSVMCFPIAVGLCASTGAQTTPPCQATFQQQVPLVYPPTPPIDACAATWSVGGTHSDPVWQAPSTELNGPVSVCWRDVLNVLSTACFLTEGQPNSEPAPWNSTWDAAGFPLNINLLAQPSIGDFLPPSPTLGGTSACLVPDAARQAETGWQGLSRPTLDGTVDLVTGLPLIQVQDLSLPVDGASFRLMRTRSQDARISVHSCHRPDRWWDWAGEGWMISENPFLMIDSANPEVVGDQPRTTYLILDAHRSIPFQFIGSTGLYEAPARFRARMTHDGNWNSGTRTWTSIPNSYTISLFDGQLKYTFVAIHEDVPKNRWQDAPLGPAGLCTSSGWCESSLHDRPFLYQQLHAAGARPNGWSPWVRSINPGVGLPHYGLCTLIQDAYGHSVKINYCDFTQQSMDTLTTTCLECSQTCSGKGQIKSVVVSSSQGPRWTLMYLYRAASTARSTDLYPTGPGDGPTHYGRRVIDSIYVFEGDKTAEVNAYGPCVPYPPSYVQSTQAGQANADVIDSLPAPEMGALEALWKHRVRYHYNVRVTDYGPPIQAHIADVPLLLKTTVESRQAELAPVTTSRTVFKYDDAAFLQAVFQDGDVETAVARARSMPGGASVTANQIATWDLPSGGALSIEDAVIACASIRLSNEGAFIGNSGSTSTGPDWSSLTTPVVNGSQYIKQDRTRIMRGTKSSGLPAGEVQRASLRGEDGTVRHYRLFRLAVTPPGTSTSGNLTPSENLTCFPSAFHAPYVWQGYAKDESHLVYSQLPSDFTEARWITIIDEFQSREEMDSSSSYGTGSGNLANYAIKAGQVGRRVVEVSASGVTLRDRSWQFTDAGAVTSGSGLGEEFIYEKVAILLGDLPGEPVPDPSLIPIDRMNEFTLEDPVSHLRYEVVLVEHRSVGWSAAYLADLQNGGGPDDTLGCNYGFTRFYEYERIQYYDAPPGTLVHPDVNEDDWPDNRIVSLELKAEGIKRGRVHTSRSSSTQPLQLNIAGGPRLYVRRVFRPGDPNVITPFEMETNVQFSRPVDGSYLLNFTQPSADARSADWAATHVITYRRHEPGSTVPVPQRPVRSRLQIGAPRQQEADSSDWYFPIEREWYSDGGSVDWAASGLVLDPVNPQPSNSSTELQSLSFTRYLRDSLDRPVHTIMDAFEVVTITLHPDAPPLNTALIGAPPDSWSRIPSTGALNYVTAFKYDNPGSSLSDMFFPNGRRWASRVLIIEENEHLNPTDLNSPLEWNQSGLPPNWTYGAGPDLKEDEKFAREFVFNDIERRTGSNGSLLYSRVLGEVKDYSGRDTSERPIRVRKVYFADERGGPAGASPNALPESLTFDPAHQPRFIEEAKVQLSIDSNGRPSNATLLEPDPNGAMLAVGTKEVNDLVDVLREREVDGTITRVTRNKLGQPIRTYAGTEDRGWSLPNEPANLVLLDATKYGDGISDALLPTVSRRYTSHPEPWASDFYGTPPTVDQDGYATITRYDWRMRPVRSETFGEDENGNRDPSVAPCLATSITILDHLDRPIIEVSFGVGPVSMPNATDLNPVTRTAEDEESDPRPLASRYLDPAKVTPSPTSLIEKFYGPDGTLVETRTYDVGSSAASPRWHTSVSYAGRGGVEVYSQRPQSPLRRATVDGLGRLTQERQLEFLSGSWTSEVSRTDFTIDGSGNVVDTARLERVLADAQPVLSATTNPNAVRSRTASWFDPKKRLTASVELGTEQPDGYVAGNPVYTRLVNAENQLEPWLEFNSSNPSGPPTFHDPNFFNDRSPQAPLATLPDVLLTANHYDLATGRLTHTRNPDGTITEHLYDRAGRLASKIENRFGDESQRRPTHYTYQYGRLVRLNAPRVKGGQVIDQITTVTYGADIVAEHREGNTRLYSPVSRRNDLVGRMSLPNETDGKASTANDIVLRYTFDGKVAERIDARGLSFRYFYDALGRLLEVVVGRYEDPEFLDYGEKFPDSMSVASGTPLDRVGYVQYEYDDRGHLSDVRAYVSRGGEVVSHNRYTYDLRGNLTGELQLHGIEITSSNQSTTPTINYSWAYEESNLQVPGQIGFDRLTSMTYPAQSGKPRRVVELGYGADGTMDDTISRLYKLSSFVTGQSAFGIDIARFQYVGVARRRALMLGHGTGALAYDLHTGTEPGLAGLDHLGRVTDMHYKGAGAATLFRSKYGYDVAGNRSWAEITQAPVAGQTQANVRSQLNKYNSLNQLTGTKVGQLDFLSQAPTPIIQNLIRSDEWTLDILGNWNKPHSVGDAGRYAEGNLDGGSGLQLGGYLNGSSTIPWMKPGANAASDVFAITHETDGQNKVAEVRTHEGDPGVLQTTQTRYDPVGNMTFDGTYFYQYDAWNRLIQVNRATLDQNSEVVIEELVKHHSYDGFGRLIRTQSPYPSPDDNQGLRAERFYYDGVRRIQEVVADPLMNLSMAASSSNNTVQSTAIVSGLSQSISADGPVDLSATSLAVEQTQIEQGEQQNLLEGPVFEELSLTRLEREYIWGPGDGPAGVDELLVQFDVDRKPWWVLQDSGGDIVALCQNPGTVTAAPTVAAQWTYDAYGAVLSADHLAAHPFMHCGHKGLFFDRMEVGIAETSAPGSSAMETPRLIPFAHAIYHNRNRAYNPQFGRFMQQDPNATAMNLLSAASYNGRGMAALVAAFDMGNRYGDGANLYEYLGSNPWRRFDPMGLSWDPFDMVDQFVLDSAMERAALMEQMGKGAAAASYVGLIVVSMLPFPITGIAADIGASMLEGNVPPELVVAGKIVGAVALGAVVYKIGKAIGHGLVIAGNYVMKHGIRGTLKNGANALGGLMGRAGRWVERKREVGFFKGCGCFAAATVVWTVSGLVPIEQVQPGDQVLAFNEITGCSELRVVLEKIVTPGAALLDLEVRHSEGRIETIRTTDEHPFWVVGEAERAYVEAKPLGRWRRADQLHPGDFLLTLVGSAVVLRVSYTQDRQAVHNFTVEGLHTYRIGENGIAVHNCDYRKGFLALRPDMPTNWEVHHSLPQRESVLSTMAAAGINVHEPRWLRGMEPKAHDWVDAEWGRWLKGRNPTASEILDFAGRMDVMILEKFPGRVMFP